MDGHDNVAGLFLAQARRHAARPFLHWKEGARWRSLSWQETAHAVANVAARLVALRLEPGARAAILAENRPEWLIADLACLAAGVVDVPLYATAPAADVVDLLARSGAQALFVSTPAQWRKVAAQRHRLPRLRHVFAFDDGGFEAGPVEPLRAAADGSALAGEAARAAAHAVRERLERSRRADVATLLFTSGTSGDPKGVLLTHGNLLANCAAMLRHIPLGPGDLTLSFLPLSHCFERTAGHYALIAAGGSIAYASAIDAVVNEVREVRPTLLLGVPRFYEKVHDRILGALERAPRYRRALFDFARRVAAETREWRRDHGERAAPPLKLRFRHELAERLVRSLLRKRFGGRVRFLVSGGAPLDPELATFFDEIGLPLLEGYGLTETAPVVACNRPGRAVPGSVGEPLPGVEVALAEDGEILVRGENVFAGYLDDPEATRAAFTADGAFRTGDVGRLDAGGRLWITDRKKDLIIGSNGKNVAPARVEERLKRRRIIADACVVGDRRPYLVALVVPDETALKPLLAARGIEWLGRREMAADERVRALFAAAIEEANAELSPPERVRRFALLAEPFSAESHELTPTLKVRRRVVERRWQATLAALYADPAPVP